MELNTMVLRGRVGSDPVLHVDQKNPQPFARFRMVVPRSRRRDDGTWEDLEGRWYTIKAWGNLAQNVAFAIRKGQPVSVIGRPVAQGWVDKDGAMTTELAVNALTVGHDLNWGISTYSKVVRKDAEMVIESDRQETSMPADTGADNGEEVLQGDSQPVDVGTNDGVESGEAPF